MERMIQVEVVVRSGLCINIGKCRSMIFQRGRREYVERIDEIEVVYVAEIPGDCYL